MTRWGARRQRLDTTCLAEQLTESATALMPCPALWVEEQQPAELVAAIRRLGLVHADLILSEFRQVSIAQPTTLRSTVYMRAN